MAKEKALAVRMGNMNTVATPYTQKDTIRVVMLPGGNGDVIGFVINTEGKVGSRLSAASHLQSLRNSLLQ